MTQPPTVPDPPAPPPERPPFTPRPPNLVLAVLLFGVLIYIVTLDAHSETYDASYATYGLIITIAGILGVDLTRFWRK